MLRKQTRDPIQPREINPNVPRNLNDLCVRLLRRDAKTRRPGGKCCGSLGSAGPSFRRRRATSVESPFIGREQQTAELHDAFRATREGKTVVVYVHGNSGMGKTELVRTFLDQLKQKNRSAIFLQGRCYERESVLIKRWTASSTV